MEELADQMLQDEDIVIEIDDLIKKFWLGDINGITFINEIENLFKYAEVDSDKYPN